MKRIVLLLVILAIALNGCGGGGHNTASMPTDSCQPAWPIVKTISDSGAWSGTIALRFGNAGNDGGSIYMITPSGTNKVDEVSNWYGSIKWSPLGTLLASRDMSFNAVFMDHTGTKTGGGGCDDSFCWLNDGSGILTGNKIGISLIETNGRTRQILDTGSVCFSPSITRDGKYVYFLTRLSGGNILYRVETTMMSTGLTFEKCERIWQFPADSNETSQLEVLPNGRVVLGFQGVVWLYDPAVKGRVDSVFQDVNYMKLSPDGKQLLVSSGGSMTILDTTTLTVVANHPVAPIDSGYSYFDDGTWSPDGKAIALYIENYKVSQAVYIWNISENSLTKVYEGAYPISTTRAYGEQSVSLSWAP